MAMDGGVVREVLTEVLQLGFLLIARDTDVAALPGGDALFQAGVIERAAAPQDELKLALLAGGRPQFLLEGGVPSLGYGFRLSRCSCSWLRRYSSVRGGSDTF